MRELILDTETTGLDAEGGDRVVEIGCVEIVNLVPTGGTYHRYINPERPMSEDAYAVHGLGDAFLADKPVFAELAKEFYDFLGDARVVAHNAPFDVAFLNAELRRAGFPTIHNDRVVDTLAMARQRYPGAQATLDALCRRYGIDNSNRTIHGALLDAQLLAEVYLELRGGRQPGLTLAGMAGSGVEAYRKTQPRPPRPHAPSAEELEAHAAMLEKLTDPMWTR